MKTFFAMIGIITVNALLASVMVSMTQNDSYTASVVGTSIVLLVSQFAGYVIRDEGWL